SAERLPSEYPATLQSDEAIDGAPACDAVNPCPEGLECMVLRLDSGDVGPLCLDPVEACAAVDCRGGDCLIAESYPAQLFCSGDGGGDGADDPVSSDGA